MLWGNNMRKQKFVKKLQKLLQGLLVLAAKFGESCDEKQYAENTLFNQNYIDMLQCKLYKIELTKFF